MLYILKKFYILTRHFSTNSKSLSLIKGEFVKDLKNEKKNDEDNLKTNEVNEVKEYEYYKLKVYNSENNTLHPWEEDN